jgi:type VI protein secretion system component VasK
MIYVILLLTLGVIAAILYSRWRSKQANQLQGLHEEKQAAIAETKKEVEAIQKELENEKDNYNSVYDAYRRKYTTGPRSTTTPSNTTNSSD